MQTALPARLGSGDDQGALASTRGGRIALAVSANALLALCAHVSVPLIFTPVPITLQTFAVLLIGLVLEPALAFSAIALYLAEGAFGLPVFSPAGPGGVAQLLGFTGGFLLSYAFAAPAAAFVFRSLRGRLSSFASALAAGIAATAVIFLIGSAWIECLTHAPWATVARIGIFPFLPGEVIKVVAAAASITLRRSVRS